ncbi:hypothetical protein ACIBBB_33340 [Streptomyces sp. NPDC051217]|uniref:hypothetical protein n=1 Tax=Streptomyces sp. NPDC051217 TaxID=3365644 RepID=UPI0037B770E8
MEPTVLAVMPVAPGPMGIIPFTTQRAVWPLEAFYVHDDTALVEMLTALLPPRAPQ